MVIVQKPYCTPTAYNLWERLQLAFFKISFLHFSCLACECKQFIPTISFTDLNLQFEFYYFDITLWLSPCLMPVTPVWGDLEAAPEEVQCPQTTSAPCCNPGGGQERLPRTRISPHLAEEEPEESPKTLHPSLAVAGPITGNPWFKWNALFSLNFLYFINFSLDV